MFFVDRLSAYSVYSLIYDLSIRARICKRIISMKGEMSIPKLRDTGASAFRIGLSTGSTMRLVNQ